MLEQGIQRNFPYGFGCDEAGVWKLFFTLYPDNIF